MALATQYGRYGYRRITALLRSAGWEVGKDRVQRIWRREGLKVPQKQRPPKTAVAEQQFLCAAEAALGARRWITVPRRRGTIALSGNQFYSPRL